MKIPLHGPGMPCVDLAGDEPVPRGYRYVKGHLIRKRARRKVRKPRRAALFKRFVESNPPKMPKNFSHAAYKRMVNYAWVAFVTGYNTGENDVCRGRMLSPLSTTT